MLYMLLLIDVSWVASWLLECSIHNYFDIRTKLFSDLYLAKFLGWILQHNVLSVQFYFLLLSLLAAHIRKISDIFYNHTHTHYTLHSFLSDFKQMCIRHFLLHIYLSSHLLTFFYFLNFYCLLSDFSHFLLRWWGGRRKLSSQFKITFRSATEDR